MITLTCSKTKLIKATRSFLRIKLGNNPYSKIDDYEEMIRLWIKSVRGSTDMMWIETRMIALNEIQLKTNDSYNELIRRRLYSMDGSDLRQQIEVMMSELNKIELLEVTNYSNLLLREENLSYGSKAMKLVRSRMAELNKTCFDYDKLIYRLKISTKSSFSEKQIKKQNERITIKRS